jgi:NAD-reducing hydrogenase small subunit
MGGIPALRNTIPLKECLDEAYIKGPTVYNPGGQIPNDPALPLLLDKVYPCRDLVKVDVSIPGCPPSADALWSVLTSLLEGREPVLRYELLSYD